MTLVECIVAVAVLSILVLGVASITTTTEKSAGSSRALGQVGQLLSTYASAIQALPYYDCASSATYDQAMRDQSQTDPKPFLPMYAHLSANTGFGPSSVQITNFEDSCPDGKPDVGTQRMTIKASIGTRSASDNIVKRDSEPATLRPVAVLSGGPGYQYPTVGYGPSLLTGRRDPVQSYAVTGVGSWASAGIYSYEYVCDTRHPEATKLAISYVVSDPSLNCSYDALLATDTTNSFGDAVTHLPDGSFTYVEVEASLTVTDNFGQSSSTTVTVRVYDRDPAVLLPDSSFVWSPGSPDVGQVVNFVATGGDAVVQWDWDFGDVAFAGPASRHTCRGSIEDCVTVSHTYVAPGPFLVKLTVRKQDTPQSAGVSSTTSQMVTVVQPPLPKPNPSFTVDSWPDPAFAVAPQRVNLDGRASRDAYGNAIPAGGYEWEIRDSAGVLVWSGTGETASYKIPAPGTYSLYLKVTDSAGASTVSPPRQLTLRPLGPPTGVYASNAYAPLFGATRVTITWTNVPHLPSDVMRYNILIRNTNGGCAFGILNLNNSTGSYVTDNGRPVQSYTWQIPGSFVSFMRNVACIGSRYVVEMQSVRTDSDGQEWISATSPPFQFSFSFGFW